MKKILLSLCLLGMVTAFKAQWNFQFNATTMSGTPGWLSPVQTHPNIAGFTYMYTADLSSYVCEGGQFKLQNLSNGFYNNCLSGNETINSSAIWDASWGEIFPAQGQYNTPTFISSGTIINNQLWPQGSGLTITVPIGNAPSFNNTNNDPLYVYYLIAIAPVMGCNYFGVYNTSAGCTDFLYMKIKVKRAPKRLNDFKVCPGTTITNALLGLPSGVTATNWTPSDPRVVPPTVTTHYYYTLSNGSCPINDDLILTVNNAPTELFTTPITIACPSDLPIIGGNAYMCASRIYVNGTLVFDGNQSNSEIVPAYFNSNGNFQITIAGTYNITYEYFIDNNFYETCTKTYQVIVPKKPKMFAQNFVLCDNTFPQVCAPQPPVGSYYTYKWTKQGSNLVFGTDMCFTPGSFGTYYLTITDQYGCQSSNTYNFSLSPSANPNSNFGYNKAIATMATYTATAYASNTSNTWYLILSDAAGNEYSSPNNQTVGPNGSNSVIFAPVPLNQYWKLRHVVSSTPCSVSTSTSYVDFAMPSGNKQSSATSIAKEETELTVFPNPGKGVFTLALSKYRSGVLEVYDITGKKVQSLTVENDLMDYTLDLTGKTKGIYMVNFISNGTITSKRIVLE